MATQNRPRGIGPLKLPGISEIVVKGYKSIYDETKVEIRPLTILAGANSSGKSNLMQPLLLIKQTLDSPYDPGPLRLLGPNVRITSADQMLSLFPGKKRNDKFSIKFTANFIIGETEAVQITFWKSPKTGLGIYEIFGLKNEKTTALEPDIMKNVTIYDIYDPFMYIKNTIHVPGLRGNPERMYPKTSFGPPYLGTFENYAASIIAYWQTKRDKRLEQLNQALNLMGLTWKIQANAIDDAQIELLVGRARHSARGGARDLVNISDVGFGLSQSLPVVVALLTAEPGQLVYIEQPELHLHPRAQAALAQLLADAARRGVRVVAETHSSILVLGVQTLVAEGKLAPELVKLHWFQRGDDGASTITSADLDRNGAFGDWPEDFDEVELEAESRYLNAAERE